MVTDTLPSYWANGQEIVDTIIDVDVAGLTANESYDRSGYQEGDKTCVVTFYKMVGEDEVEGLEAGTEARTITVTFTTKVNHA